MFLSGGMSEFCFFFFFNDTATTEIYTLSLHDALPIFPCPGRAHLDFAPGTRLRRMAPSVHRRRAREARRERPLLRPDLSRSAPERGSESRPRRSVKGNRVSAEVVHYLRGDARYNTISA